MQPEASLAGEDRTPRLSWAVSGKARAR